MALAGQVSGNGPDAPRGTLTHATTLRTAAGVVIADATGDVFTKAQMLNVDGLGAVASVAGIKAISMGIATRVRLAARAPVAYSAVSASPAVAVLAIDADGYDAAAGVFTGLRSAERIDAADQDADGTALTFEGTPANAMVRAGDRYITPYTSDLDAKGRPFVVVVLLTKFAGTTSGTLTPDIIAETTN